MPLTTPDQPWPINGPAQLLIGTPRNQAHHLPFTVDTLKSRQADSYLINREDVSEAPREETAVRVYRHSQSYITGLLQECGLILRKRLEFVAFSYPAENREVTFTAYVAQRQSHS